ncbi:heme biosynthesis HemY N-terminal domain-containing protein [Acidisoma sp. 7E03]
MRRVLGFLLLAVILVGIAYGIGAIPGDVTASVGPYTFQASLPIVVLALILLFLLLYGVTRLLALLVSAPGRFGRGRHQRQLRQGEFAVTRAFSALAAGDAKAARREAARARRLLPEAPMALLVSAEAARLAGRTEEMEAEYRRLAEIPDAAFLGLRGLLRQAIDAGDWTLAADLARRAELAHPGALWLRRERARLALRTGAWAEALALAGPDAPRAVMATAAAEATEDPMQAMRLAKEAYNADPTLSPAVLAYARRLRAARDGRKAEQVVERAWARAPHPDLAAFYLEPEEDALARVKRAEKLAGFAPGHGESALVQARASLAAKLTGEARRLAQRALDAGLDQRRVWVLLADIEEADAAAGGGEAATFAAHEALRRAQSAGPDPRWHCTECGTDHAAWHAACPACSTVGTVVWTAETGPARRAASRALLVDGLSA